MLNIMWHSRNKYLPVPEYLAEHCNCEAHSNTKEGQANLLWGEPVQVPEYDRENLEHKIQNTQDER